ncbi:unnamed protein product [Vitrella brassicaformis CCMP3155]|uniref:Uncharacterized protein n=2 Tax=Vitrella brassicaformis TaxID=1169539 RepID=A0A0G4GDM0_VITBC|nr:unnamed protein product [Vitrella brassicaformis CCMP3155]|eukprot:CEM27492.1 unnamed protein product [Vitrella brassicaformis CCMP3155]
MHPAGFLPSVVALLALQGGQLGAKDINCRNPLFAGHWFSTNEEIGHLSPQPQTYADLLVCPQFNGRPSCCTPSIASQLRAALASWTHHLQAQLDDAQRYLLALREIRKTQAFNNTATDEKAHFDEAMDAVCSVFKSHQRCFDGILEVTSGLLCFACAPDWKRYVGVEKKSGGIAMVSISESSCGHLWMQCRDMGLASKRLLDKVLDSHLTRRVAVPLPQLDAFQDEELLCKYAMNVIALRPFLFTSLHAPIFTKSHIDMHPDKEVLMPHSDWDAVNEGRQSQLPTRFRVQREGADSSGSKHPYQATLDICRKKGKVVQENIWM